MIEILLLLPMIAETFSLMILSLANTKASCPILLVCSEPGFFESGKDDVSIFPINENDTLSVFHLFSLERKAEIARSTWSSGITVPFHENGPISNSSPRDSVQLDLLKS